MRLLAVSAFLVSVAPAAWGQAQLDCSKPGCAVLADPPITPRWNEEWVACTTRDCPRVLSLAPLAEMWTTFPSAGVSLGPHGEVRVYEQRDLDETARRFWNAVARVRNQPEPFPGVKDLPGR